MSDNERKTLKIPKMERKFGKGGKVMIGKFKHSIDAKGRLFIPARFREKLGNKIVICMSVSSKCLNVYSRPNWDKFEAKLKNMPEIEMDDGLFWLYGNATEVEVDSQGRFALDADLREMAGLEKDIISLGWGDKIEIWDEKAFYDRMKSINPVDLRGPFSKQGM